MLQYLKKRWNYFLAKRNEDFEQSADPKVQLEQAINEAKDQHTRLRGQAANVIANQKQTELRLNRAIEELERINGNARQAVKMADDAARAGNRESMERYTDAAEQFANRLITLEEEIESLKSLYFQASDAADQAKAAVEQNAALLQKKLGQRQALLSQLDQAKMQETVNSAMRTLSEAVGEDVPTFDQVRDKIEARYAKAKATAELTEGSVEAQMHEVEKAARKIEAQSRLDAIRTNLGIEAPGTPDAIAESTGNPDSP
ncbi:MAG: PspA/IM30 family protein [Acidimicrobiaceae bacterium]|nr:PspA/IM30 family protein [Acidimicrobiaceae bacterium]MDE0606457.1 PspA/IM30 family protein [Acidimicrobiaceae bacterium]